MLDGCIYHILRSLIPPAGNEWHEFRQLAFLSACTLIERDVSQILDKIPPRILESLFQACIYKHFHTPGKKEKLPQPLVQLITHWPYEELNLSKLMPQLPPHERKFSASLSDEGDGPLDEVREELERFYEHIVKCMSQIIALRQNKPLSTSSPLKKLNVSDLLGGASLFNPKSLLSNIWDSYFSSVPENKFELICDIWLNGNDEVSIERMKELRWSCKDGGLNVVFHKAALWGGIPEGALQVLSENNIKDLEIRGCYVNEKVTSTLVKSLPNLQGLSFTCFTTVRSLHFLNDMSNLQHLDLTSLDLRDGKIAPLCFAPHGLKYLSLADCRIDSFVFELLFDSPHLATLRQLDLTLIDFSAFSTSFSDSISWNPLLRLCDNLYNIEVLVLRACNLAFLIEELISPLVDSLKSMANLTLLDLAENYFSPHLLSKHFVNLRENQSLRYLKLSVDEDEFYDIYKNTISKENIAKFISKMNTELNIDRAAPLHVFFPQKKSAHISLLIQDEDVEVDTVNQNESEDINEEYNILIHSNPNRQVVENKEESDADKDEKYCDVEKDMEDGDAGEDKEDDDVEEDKDDGDAEEDDEDIDHDNDSDTDTVEEDSIAKDEGPIDDSLMDPSLLYLDDIDEYMKLKLAISKMQDCDLTLNEPKG